MYYSINVNWFLNYLLYYNLCLNYFIDINRLFYNFFFDHILINYFFNRHLNNFFKNFNFSFSPRLSLNIYCFLFNSFLLLNKYFNNLMNNLFFKNSIINKSLNNFLRLFIIPNNPQFILKHSH